MRTLDVSPTRVRVAIGLSIAAHICALWLLAVLLSDRRLASSSSSEIGPTFTVKTIIYRARLQSTPSITPAVVARAVSPARQTAAPVQARTIGSRPPSVAPRSMPQSPAPLSIAQTVTPEARDHADSRPIASTASIPTESHLSIALVEPQSTATAAPVPTTAPTSMPTPTSPMPAATNSIPTPAPTPISTATNSGNFTGLFSQNYPPTLTSRADLAGIRSRLSTPVHIRIEVDESGRATDVRFIEPVSDPQLAEEIRSTLLGLHYVPADCNGLHCDGTLDIHY